MGRALLSVVAHPLSALLFAALGALIAFPGILVSLSLSPFVPSTAAHPGINLVPLPSSHKIGSSPACLAKDFHVELPDNAPGDLKRAADRMLDRIRKSQHAYLSVSAGEEFFAASSAPCGPDNEITILTLRFSDSRPIAHHATRKAEHRAKAEGYKLRVPVRGAANAEGDTALGMFRALTTFENLVYKVGNSLSAGEDTSQLPLGGDTETTGRSYLPFAPYEISDAPAFAWRGVLLDTSRHFFSKRALLRMLDAMAAVKLSVFHWHITDSNSWPLDLAAFPELAGRAAYRGRKYSESDVREVVAYAAERGIDVVLEIDTPGHTATIGESHPDMIACREHVPWTGYANQPPAGQLRFADEGVARFAANLFTAAAGLVESPYFSTGGDELNLRCMAEDGPTQTKLRERGMEIEDALRDFTRVTHGALSDAGKTPLVWQEMVLAHGDMALHPDTIVDIWASSADVRPVLDKGFRVVHAPADYFYLDCGQGGWVIERGGSNSWCDPFKSWAQMYSFDPYNNVAPEQRKLVLGGQACLWAEQTDETNFDSVMWPRAAAVAELFWTGAGAEGFPRNAQTALPRMHDIRYRLVDRGVGAVPLQPEWCALRPGVCILNG